MTERRQPKKMNDLILTRRKLFSLRRSIKPFSFAVSNSAFFKWSTQKYGIFRNWRIRFPTLLFPLRNLAAFVRSLSFKRISISAPERNHYHSQNLLYNINLLPRISLIAERSRALHDETVQTTFPDRDPEGRYPVFIPAEERAWEQKPELRLETQRILSKLTKMLVTVKPDNQLKSPSKIASSFLRITHISDKIHYFGDTRNWGDRHEPLLDRKSIITSPGNKSAPFRQLVHAPTEGDFGTERSRIGKAWDPVSDRSMPGLHHFNPLKVALDDLRESVASMERKGVEDEVVAGRPKPPESSAAEKTSDVTHKTNINMDHLTNQVYQMLERKIRIERERRGL